MFAATSGRLSRVLQDLADVAVDLELELHVEVEELQPFAGGFGAAERHRPERGGGGVLEGALQARLVALDQQLGRLEVGRQPVHDVRLALASAATRSLHLYHQAMSCGLTNETVVHHGSAPPSAANQSANLAAMCGSTCQPWPGAPSGEG